MCAVYRDMCVADTCMRTKKESGKEKTEKAEQAETKFKDRESLEMSLLTVYYPKTWKYDKENMQEDEDYAYVRFFDGKTADESENVVYCLYRSNKGGFIQIS